MKINKKQEKELLQVYDKWLHSYLNGDVKTYDFYLDDDYRFIGSTDNEEFLNKEDTTKFFAKTADQLAGKTDIKNTVRTVEFIDGIAFITDLFDAYFLIGKDWTYYGRFRFTSALSKNKAGWRFIYQHFSMPDAKAQEGETLGAEQISKENQELRDAIKRRTVELEQKNRELEIEAALERVRALAMGMHKQKDLLKICKQVYIELQSLGFTNSELRNVQIIINNDDKGKYYRYQHSKQQGSEFAEVPYKIHPTVTYLRDQLKKSDKAFVGITIKGGKLTDWKDFVNSFPQKHDKELNAATELHYYFHSVGIGALGISSYQKLAEDKVNLLRRFSNVFNLAYQRYEDITQAETQAREAQIELGLERVRARAMAMQNSNELSKLVDTLLQELTKLDFSLTACIINIIDGDDKSNTVWVTSPEPGNNPESYYLKFEDHKFHHGMWKAWKARKAKWVYTVEGEEKKMYDEYLFNKTEFRRFSKKAQKEFRALERYVASFTFSNFGGLQTIGEEPLSSENLDILARFGKVFDLTYTRFNDLKLAEEQAREAQIELALERVRARTMAMRYSTELADVATVLFQQVKELGIPQWTCGFNIWETGDTEFTFYPGGPDGEILPSCKVSLTEHPIFRQFDESRKRGDDLFVYEKKGEVQADHYRYMHSLPGIGDMLQGMLDQGLEFPNYQIDHIANFSYGNIVFITYEPFPKMHQVFIRFAKVFDQTYTRFLDLQKAEKQAREVEIELALERVRAKTMAMQHSDELQEVINSVYDRLIELEIEIHACTIITRSKNPKELLLWYASSAQQYFRPFHLPKNDNLMIKSIWKGLNNTREIFSKTYLFEEKNEFLNYLYKHTDFKNISESIKKLVLEAKAYSISNTFMKHAGIQLQRYSDKRFSNQENEILIRFGKVFEQTYIRFLDLQKAEAQAREAQIETSLERVRAASMAMHHSADLLSVISIVLEQFEKLDIPVHAAFIYDQMEDTKAAHFWAAAKGLTHLKQTHIPRIKHPFFEKFYKAIKNGTSFYTLNLTKAEKNQMFSHYFTKSSHIDVPLERQEFILSSPGLVNSTVLFDNTALAVQRYNKDVFTDDENQVIKRIGFVFEQAYTRFLDLQKAEAQAKEAQIEAALERVRSRSMAMHKSEELKEVIQIVYEQFIHLKIHIEHTGFIIDYKANDDMHIWLADEHEVPSQVTIPYFDAAPWNSFIEAKKKNKNFYAVKLTFKEKNNFYKKLLKHISDLPEEARQFYLKCPGLALSCVLLDNIGLYIENFDGTPYTEEENNILMRFGKVFQQTYTRFLDLQKAEAQAKEAQIETSLERVRTTSMAMHHSTDLQAVISIILEQFEKLDIPVHAAFIYDQLEDTKAGHFWVAAKGETYLKQTHIPRIKYPFFEEFYKAIKTGTSFYTLNLTKAEKNRMFRHYFTKSSHIDVPLKRQEFIFSTPGLVSSTVLFDNTALAVQRYNKDVFTDDENEVIKRIGFVFEQAYTRFLDLQKAENQAKKAEIELALERVRAKTMAMQHSDELREVVRIIYKQLGTLNFDVNACNIIIMEESGGMQYWVSGFAQDIYPKSYHVPNLNHPYLSAQFDAWKKEINYTVFEYSGKEKKSFDKLFFTQTEFRNVPEQTKQNMKGIKRVKLSTAFFIYGALQVVGPDPLTEENAKTLQRIAKVFNQAYTRFLDLQKAEAQAKEAHIEAALERVRSRSMAMHKSEELKEVIQLVYDQFVHLNINIEHTGFIIDYKEQDDMHIWLADKQKIPSQVTIPYFDSAHWNDFKEAKEKGIDFFVNKLSFAEKNKFYKKLFKFIPDLPEEAKKFYLTCPGLAASTVLLDNIGLYIENFEGVPYSDEENKTLMRFGKVFQQTYTRFLDLQKAEKQARKAQIEIALERTRTQSMLMQHSDDLNEVSKVFHEQLIELNIPSEFSYVWLPNEEKKDHMFWATWSENTAVSTTIKSKAITYDLDKSEPYTAACFKAWASDEPVHICHIPSGKIDTFFATWKELLRGAKKLKPKFFREGFYYAEAYMKYGCFGINIRRPLNKEEQQILERFSIEFERTYTKFLNLQKAEAQAREAKIEVALEKIRSRTMVMQHSDELPEAANNLFLQVQDLGIPAWSAGYCVWEDNQESAWCNMSSEGEIQKGFSLPTIGVGYNFYKPLKNGETFYVTELGGKKLVKHYDFMKKLPIVGEILEEFDKKGIALPTFQIFHIVYFTHGYLMFITYEKVPNEWDVFKRFGQVFDQTYTRFLDLQKAEDQAREAQIEAALEKVRSRSLAMHKSDEVGEVANILLDKLQELDVAIDNEAIIMVHSLDGSRNSAMWLASPELYTSAIGFNVPYMGHVLDKSLWDAIEIGMDYFTKIFSHKVKNTWFRWAFEHSDIKSLPEERKKFVLKSKDYRYFVAIEKYTSILIPCHTGISLIEAQIGVLKRFSKVFEQAYIRFLDLQKAEEQSRTAQINLAVERVRAKALAMHKSEDIMEVVAKLKDEVMNLDIPDVVAATIFLKEGDDKVRMWDLSSLEKLDDVYQVHTDIIFKLKKTDPHLYIKRVWENPENYFVETQDKKGFKRILEYIREHDKTKEADELEAFIKTTKLKRLYHATKKLNNGKLCVDLLNPPSDEMETILTKMGAAFDLAYKRFEDLQKAEQQAREAQIETSLERLRSSTMAMHKSEDLLATANLLYKEFRALGITQYFTCGFVIVDEENSVQNVWVTDMDGEIFESFNLPLTGDPVFQLRYEKWRQKVPVFYQKVGGVKLKKHLAFAIPHFGSEEAEDMVANQFPDPTYFYMANFSHGYLHIVGDSKLTEEEEDLLARFMRVFEQTYTRFLDLKKAEEQAREAQVEAALERVRAKSMAMHKTSELKMVIDVISEQFAILGIAQDACMINIFSNETSKDWNFWIATYPDLIHVPFFKNPIFSRLANARKKNEVFYSLDINQEEKNKFFKHFYKMAEGVKVVRKRRNFIFKATGWTSSVALSKFASIHLINYNSKIYTEEENQVLQRIGMVFEQTYTRFLDLQKAEDQAREAQIEAALERVRSKTMAMHNSQDVKDAVITLFEEILKQNDDESIRCGIGVLSKSEEMELWTASFDKNNKVGIDYGSLNMNSHPLLIGVKKSWKAKKERFFYKLKGKELVSYFDVLNNAKEYTFKTDITSLPNEVFHNSFIFSEGVLFAFTSKPIPENTLQVFKKFTTVFEQTYTRFLDLQKAEAQVREAQIEAALERVRSKTMAMHNSKDVGDTVVTLFKEVLNLGLDQSIRCGIGILEGYDGMQTWSATFDANDEVDLKIGMLNMTIHPLLKGVKSWWKKGKTGFKYQLIGNDVFKYYKALNDDPGYPFNADLDTLSEKEFHNSFVFAEGILFAFTRNSLSEEAISVLKRFTTVFEQTYTRFLDLQKAETQAREAQIEASLERVRAQAMAMHSTEDLTDTVGQLFQELDSLDISLLRCGVGRIHKDSKVVNLYTYSGGGKGSAVPIVGNAVLKGHPVLEGSYLGWVKQKEYHAILKGASLKKYFKIIKPDFKLPEKQNHKVQYGYFFYFSAGCLYTFTETEFTKEELSIFRKFNSVVGLTYRRFLDLGEAEEQARKATIEASLERVRSKAMAMHNSKDLVISANQLFQEFQQLEISFLRCGVLKIKENKTAEVFSYSQTKDNNAVAVFGNLRLIGHELMDGVFSHWKLQKEYVHEMKGEEVKRYYQLINKQLKIPKLQQEKTHFGYAFYFPEGCLYCFTNEKLSEDTLNILRKFNTVMGLTYRRYFELQEAEARELTAIKESSLDRVRAEIASMRTADDLNRITPLVWKELTTLGVPFFRCGVFIVDNQSELVHAYLSSPSGESIAALELDFESMPLVKGVVSNWKKQKVFVEKWNKAQFIEFTQPLIDQGQINNSKKYQGGLEAPDKLVLQMVPFKQGMLYVGSENSLTYHQIATVESLAKAFSVAYTRYEDFKELEAAKSKAEETLTELKSTQTQLIQSEKMASLGELTAGIAHEIQNPLNFVNNFSELSEEMVEELAEEIKDNSDEIVIEIMTDLKQNLNKITNHGKRASNIVKGMLDHSRTSSGVKELTDINALADEFLRLSYHGLRAKDKSFNADFKTDFDTSLPKTKVVAQDLGRVILNLINNAFYAVSERAKKTQPPKGGGKYKPLVIVSTSSFKSPSGDNGARAGVEIIVKDNGSGIPDKIKDKIFQPFFTTKPTGSGTGLGLSMSYDIITKGHGGELTVDSKKGEFTKFTIVLPF